MAAIQSNFAQLAEHDEQLLRLGLLAERYFPEDPNTSLLKLRQLTELLAQHVATNVGVYVSTEEAQYDLIRRLQDQGILPREMAQLFSEVRRAGNAASHALVGDHRSALTALKITWQIGVWFHRTFKNPAFRSGAFIPPRAPRDESDDLHAELARLTKELEEHRAALDDPDLVFKREGGGFARLNRIFGGELVQVLETFNDTLWQRPAA